MNGKHHDPVWELKWVEREGVIGDDSTSAETLVTVSTDGRVTQWMIRKGLEFTGKLIFDITVMYRLSLTCVYVSLSRPDGFKTNEQAEKCTCRQLSQ